MNSDESVSLRQEDNSTTDRRDFLSSTASVAMAGGLIAGYGALGVMAVRFLYPVDPRNVAWRFVATLAEFKVGQAMEFTTPSGATVVIARHGPADTVESFVALSSVCPHLGCQVHWEEQNDRFFCPCHNGVFTRDGVATEGPPALAKQSLKKFPLQVSNGMLFIEAPLTSVGRVTARLDSATIEVQPPTREA